MAIITTHEIIKNIGFIDFNKPNDGCCLRLVYSGMGMRKNKYKSSDMNKLRYI
jgi:hypothetical protein